MPVRVEQRVETVTERVELRHHHPAADHRVVAVPVEVGGRELTMFTLEVNGDDRSFAVYVDHDDVREFAEALLELADEVDAGARGDE